MIQSILSSFTRISKRGSFLRSFLIVLSFIVISRTFEYILLESLTGIPHSTIILINTILVSLLMVPGLYLLVYRPFTTLLSERRLAESNAKMFEQTIRSINGVVNIADLNDHILFVNEAFCRTYQYTEQELIGKHSSIFWSDRNPKELVAQILPATLNGGWKGELYNKRKDGTEFPIILTTSLIKDDEGKQVAVVGMVEDITEQKRAELERQTIFEITQGVAATANLFELLTVIHQALKKVIYAENCFVAIVDQNTNLMSFPYFVDQHDPWPGPGPMDRGCTAYVYRSGKPFLLTQAMFDRLVEENEVELIGTNAPSWLGVPLQTPAGTIGVLVVQHYEQSDIYSTHDVQFLHSIGTHIAMAIERKNAQNELQASEEMFRHLFDESADPILLLDETGFTRCNAATLALLGYGSEKEFLNKRPHEVSPERQPDGALSSEKSAAMMERAVKDGYNRFEWTHVKRDGSELYVEVMLTPVVLKGKQVLYTIWRDVTVRKQIEAHREQLIADLQGALEEVKTLSGIVPICANCKKIRDDKGFWEQVDQYVSRHTDAKFSHSICPDCTKTLYPEQYEKIYKKNH